MTSSLQLEIEELSEMSYAERVRFQENTSVRKVRRIPAQGQVLVSKGDRVSPETIVVRGTVFNPEIHEVKVYVRLGVDPTEAGKYVLKEKGDEVKKDEVIAINRSFLGRSKVCRSPIDGSIETFSKSSGRVFIRGKPIPVEVKAHIPGTVVDTIPGEGAIVECKASLIEGTFGIGGETVGELVTAVDKPDEALTTDLIKDGHKGKIIVGGSFVTLDALREGRENRREWDNQRCDGSERSNKFSRIRDWSRNNRQREDGAYTDHYRRIWNRPHGGKNIQSSRVP